MVRVITYGTFDLFHEGHMNILRRAKALGDYLYVGVTTENFDVMRGKINVSQSLVERMEAVKSSGFADEVFPEEYEGQKIDDIRRNGIDIFVVGNDWVGKFDYLREYCQVVYLPRTEGISSTRLREEKTINIGIVGEDPTLLKLKTYAESVNGLKVVGGLSEDRKIKKQFEKIFVDYEELLSGVDAVYIAVRPSERYFYIKRALEEGKHVLSESPIALKCEQASELFDIAEKRGCTLFDGIKTAYSLPFSRLLLLLKSGLIGDVKNIDVTCTSLENYEWLCKTNYYSSFTGWGSVALLPVLQILGPDYERVDFLSLPDDKIKDAFTKANFIYSNAVATINVGVGIKAEGDMRISGTKGYVYVPAPWWKSSYFELKYEDLRDNKSYYYKNDNDGFQMELVYFLRCVRKEICNFYLERNVSEKIAGLMNLYLESLKLINRG